MQHAQATKAVDHFMKAWDAARVLEGRKLNEGTIRAWVANLNADAGHFLRPSAGRGAPFKALPAAALALCREVIAEQAGFAPSC